MNKFQDKQRGQSMVEYTVILIALVTALITLTRADRQQELAGGDKCTVIKTLMSAMHCRYTEQNFALRISQLPERSNLADIDAYYQQLNKFPTLGKKLNGVANQVKEITKKIDKVSKNIDTLNDFKKKIKL